MTTVAAQGRASLALVQSLAAALDGGGSPILGKGEATGSTQRLSPLAVASPLLRVVTLGELLAAPLVARRPILEPWLRERHLALLYAPSGLGKSLLALSVAIAVAGAGRVPGLGVAGEARRVLYVGGEMDVPDIQERAEWLLGRVPGVDREAVRSNLRFLARLGQGRGVEFPDLMCSEGQAAILAKVEEVGADLVLLDNLSTLATVEDENDASSFNVLVDFLVEMKARGVSTLVVHHSRKAGIGEGSYRGSQKLSVIFNTILRMERTKDEAGALLRGDGASFVLHWEKYRERRDENTRTPLVMTLGDDGWVTEVDEDTRITALVAELRSLRHVSVAAAGRALGIPRTTAKRLKDRAVRLGLLSLGELTGLLRDAKAVDEDDGHDDLDEAAD